MADETIDYSYSPLGSTIELDELAYLASTRPSTRQSSPVSSAGSSISWHPELTLYRLLLILSTLGLAAAKTATSVRNLTFASITLEWILGVVVFLFFYLLGAYEGANNRYLMWLFNVDYMEYLWTFLESLHIFKRPFYLTDEIDARHQTMGVPPLVTGYRIIVTVLVASFGLTKSALLYGQEPVEATSVECVFGVGIVTGLYCLGLYEASSTKVCPTLFHVDYYDGLSYGISETAIVFLHLFALLPCSALSYVFYTYAAMTFSPEGTAKMDGTGTNEDFVMLILKGVTASAVSLGGAIGVLALMYRLGWRYHASPLARFIARRSGISYVHQNYLLPSGHSLRPRPRFFYLKRFIIRQSVKIPANIILLCGVIVVLAYCFCILFLLYSFAVQSVKDSFWPGIYLLVVSYPVVVVIMVVCTVGTLIIGYKGVVNYFSDAWNDFTVDIEPGGVPDDEPLEGV